MSFRNGVTAQSRQHIIYYLADAGGVKAKSNTHGNRIIHSLSENLSIEIDSGGQLHYELVDYGDAALWHTHSFRMSDEQAVAPGEMVPDGTNGVLSRTANGIWPAIVILDTQTGNFSFSIPHEFD